VTVVGKLIYSAITSLDGFIEDREGNFDWAEPDEEVFRFVNEVERPVGTYLYGRRMYETMVYWDTVDTSGQPAHLGEFAAMWKAADKIVYSRSLGAASSSRTRIERTFDPGAIRELKAAQTGDITVGGSDLAAQAFAAGLVDECQLFLTPVVVGGGKRSLPENVRLDLELIDERRFTSGVVFLHYRTTTS
jgi:dihydrofolate reductase